MLELNINGQVRKVDVAAETPLLWVLRDALDLTGTKYGCGVASCGACTVLVNGAAVRSCIYPAGSAAGAQITTIEHIAASKAGAAVQAAWRALEVVQCGYCQSGQMVQAAALLAANPKPTDAEIDTAMDGVACRCATYLRVRAAIHHAARRLEA